MTATLTCPECGAPMVLRTSRYGPFYGCSTYPACKGSHGAHKNGIPLGTPANAATKLARIEAHEVFDTLWKRRGMSRWEAYRWLATELKLTPDQCHIGLFDEAQCQRVIQAVQARRK